MSRGIETLIVWGVVLTLATGAFTIFYGLPLAFIATLTETTSIMLYPTRWPFYIFLFLLIGTVDREYFPTAGLVTAYLVIMFYYGHFSFSSDISTILWFSVGAALWTLIGGLWLYAKWWSYLHDPKNEHVVKNIPDGKESEFFIARIPYLYPHFLYWPFSIPHTLITKLLFQLFESIARRWGGTFARMVAARKAELKENK
jgi:hypothetical protein